MPRILPILLSLSAFVAAAADRRAPGWALMDSKLQWHDLADYRGKLVLLAFIQTTCPHCAAFAENLQQAQEKFGDKIAVVAVVTLPDSPDKVQNFIAGHKINYPILLDSGQMCFSYILTPDLKFPRLYMIDSGGTIRNDYEYSAITRDIFEGVALAPAISRMLNGAGSKK